MPRRPLPPDHKTLFYPIRVSTIEEASIKGNILVHDDIYLVQLKLNPEDVNKRAIPGIHDQLTNARNRSIQAMRTRDVSPWDRHEIFQLAFGVFHMILNLVVWALKTVHSSSINQCGSLTHLFAVLEKVRLGNEHPDFHALLAALTQVLDGLILNAWRKECGYSSLHAFAESKPTAEHILKIAHIILEKHMPHQGHL